MPSGLLFSWFSLWSAFLFFQHWIDGSRPDCIHSFIQLCWPVVSSRVASRCLLWAAGTSNSSGTIRLWVAFCILNIRLLLRSAKVSSLKVIGHHEPLIGWIFYRPLTSFPAHRWEHEAAGGSQRPLLCFQQKFSLPHSSSLSSWSAHPVSAVFSSCTRWTWILFHPKLSFGWETSTIHEDSSNFGYIN